MLVLDLLVEARKSCILGEEKLLPLGVEAAVDGVVFAGVYGGVSAAYINPNNDIATGLRAGLTAEALIGG